MQPFIDVGPTVDMDLLKVNSGDGGVDNDEVGKVFPTIIQVPLQGFFFFFLMLIFIYWKGRVRVRATAKVFHTVAHLSNAYNSQGWIRTKLEIQNSIPVLHLGHRGTVQASSLSSNASHPEFISWKGAKLEMQQAGHEPAL